MVCHIASLLIKSLYHVAKVNVSHAAFEVSPKDTNAKRNDKNIELSCQPSSNQDFIIWEVFLDNGTYWTVTGSDTARQLSRLVYSSKRALSHHYEGFLFATEVMSLCLSLDC